MSLLIAIIAILVLLAASYGWGYATIKWIARNEVNAPSFLSIAGVAVWILWGGILNLAGIAYPVTIYGLLIAGLIFCALSIFARFNMHSMPNGSAPADGELDLRDSLLPLLIVAAVMVFFAAALLPSDVFNHGDDFQTYIPRPIRMLQIGTLAGNPYELLGLDSFGAQAFLQSFILLKFPVAYLPGFDSVFCLGLAGLILVAIARRFDLGWIYATIAILVLLAINPQSVNVSALYSGVAVILGLLFASCLLAEKLNEPEIAQPLGMAGLAGLFITALVALKTTLAFFAVLYAAIFFLGLLAVMQDKRRALLLGAAATLASIVTALPWLLLYLPNYVAALRAHSHAEAETKAGMFSQYKGNVSELFASHDLFYGGSTLGYGTLVLVLAILGALAVLFVLRNKSHVQKGGYLWVSASACAAAVATYFLNGLLFPADVAIRYSCPVLIAVLPFVSLASCRSATASLISRQTGLLGQPLKLATWAGAALVLTLFGNNLYNRTVRAYNQHTTVSFPVDDGYIQYNHYTLSEQAQQVIRNIQYQTQAGTKILAWISMPLHLDFARNEIQNMMEVGVANPWLQMPFNGTADDMVQYFKEQGIRYVLWEYHGGGMRDEDEYEKMRLSSNPAYRKLAERNLYLRAMLFQIMARGNLLVHQGGVVLFDLGQLSNKSPG